ncbi:pirin family protein [Neiella marina]|uniref:Pirin family protein n=1 Tax=Neiella holothuriorum TaxID=2870530 RepID=A0ABS7ECL2_9GAMM|nr:pirin family protein [Neiella holothuriorum]MBW8189965.1 pirin family protein [Neiella holothuriorum]
MTNRPVLEIMTARSTRDGDGVHLLRVFGGPRPERFDPFLMLDDFGSDSPSDYIAGFPPHPHRGFRTMTYMQQGHFEHRDHMSHVGEIRDGGAQWMTAGRGVIHSEMPKQSEGQLRGFQLWLNLPAKDKMMAPDYQNIQAEDIATHVIDGLIIRAIAGNGTLNQQPVTSNTTIADTAPQIWFLSNPQSQPASVTIAQADQRTALLYVSEGEVKLASSNTQAKQHQLVRFGERGHLTFELAPAASVMLLTGQPLHEPIVQHGPFVMNDMAQIEQAIRDYQTGSLTDAA